MKIEKVQNFVANLHEKTEYLIHIRGLKQALNNELVLKKVHRVIKLNQSSEYRSKKNSKKWFWKRFFLSGSLMHFLEKFWKILENTDILKLSQQKEEELTWCQNQIIML